MIKASLLNIKTNHDLWFDTDYKNVNKASEKLQKNL